MNRNTPLITANDMAGQQVALLGIQEFEIVKSFDSPAHSFSAVFSSDASYPELYDITVHDGDSQLFTGTVDEQVLTEGAKGRQLKLIARSRGAVLLDNEAQPQTYGTVSLWQIFRDHIRPYGFLNMTAESNPTFMQYQIVKGTSEWEVFTNFFRSTMHGMAYMDDDCNIICGLPPADGVRHRFSNQEKGALPYSSLKIVNNRYSPITRFVIRDQYGNYSYTYDNPDTAALRLTRKRYLIPSAEFALSSGGGSFDAALRVRRSMLGKQAVTLTHPGLLSVKIADYADIASGHESFEKLFVYQIRYRFGSSGISTVLTLLDPKYL